MMVKKLINIFGIFFVNTFTVIASIAISLCAAELFVRTYMPSPDYGGGKRGALYSNLFEFDDQIGWRGVPNVKSPYFSKDFKVTISHDSYGYRNISLPYFPDKKNYLLLGDSYGWGWGVEDSETAAAVLNKDEPDLNLYSLGIPGYGTDQEYLALQKFLTMQPENHYQGVILLFYFNDFENNAMPESYLYPKPFFSLDKNNALTLQNTPVPYKKVPQDTPITTESQPDTLIQQSQLLNLATKTLFSAFFSQPVNETGFEKELLISDWETSNIKLTSRILHDLRSYCINKQMSFHVVFLVTENTDAHPASMLTALNKTLNLPNNEYSFFYSRKFPRTDLWLDTHYTPYGQALLADHIANIIRQQHSFSAQ